MPSFPTNGPSPPSRCMLCNCLTSKPTTVHAAGVTSSEGGLPFRGSQTSSNKRKQKKVCPYNICIDTAIVLKSPSCPKPRFIQIMGHGLPPRSASVTVAVVVAVIAVVFVALVPQTRRSVCSPTSQSCHEPTHWPMSQTISTPNHQHPACSSVRYEAGARGARNLVISGFSAGKGQGHETAAWTTQEQQQQQQQQQQQHQHQHQPGTYVCNT